MNAEKEARETLSSQQRQRTIGAVPSALRSTLDAPWCQATQIRSSSTESSCRWKSRGQRCRSKPRGDNRFKSFRRKKERTGRATEMRMHAIIFKALIVTPLSGVRARHTCATLRSAARILGATGGRVPAILRGTASRQPMAAIFSRSPSSLRVRLPMWLVDEPRLAAHVYRTHFGGVSVSTQLQDVSAALEGVVARLAPSLISVSSHRMQASGFVWRAGLIVTSDEGLAEEGEVRVTLPGGESTVAHIVGRDPSSAIALRKVDRADSKPAALAATVPSPGTLVVALGAWAGAPTAALGLISVSRGPWQSIRGGEIDARIEIDMRLRSTAEGGLAVNAGGQPFGMTVFGPRRRVLVIPSATIGRIAARLETHGRIPRGYLGLSLQAVTIEGGGAGVMVMGVDPKGPGAAANIHQGDILVSWDGKPIGKVQALVRSLGPDSVGKSLHIELRRGGRSHQTEIQIGERPAA
jgi:S1-C subfamily serine protease